MNNTITRRLQRKSNIIQTLCTNQGELIELKFSIDSGRIITRRKTSTLNGVMHPGIIMGEDQYGSLWILHNHYKHKQPVYERIDGYCAGEKWYFDNRQSKYSQLQIVDRAHQEYLKGKKYEFVGYNCQTFVNLIINDTKESESIDKIADRATIAGGLIFLFGLFTENKTLMVTGGVIAGGSQFAKRHISR